MENQTIRDKYEQAYRAWRAAMRRPPVAGNAGKSLEKAQHAAYLAMESARDRLIAAGGWDGPIPIKSKKKYRA